MRNWEAADQELVASLANLGRMILIPRSLAGYAEYSGGGGSRSVPERRQADDGKRLPAMDVACPPSLILLNKGRGLGRGGEILDSIGGPADLFSVLFRVFFSRWFLEGLL